MLEDLRGKGALVTGASTGIGAAAAEALAALGVRVAVHYNRSGDEAAAVIARIRDAGGMAVAVRGDLATAEAGPEVVRAAAEGLGRLDILVNNAGSLIRRQAFMELELDLYQAVLDLNVRQVIAVSQAAVPHMREGGAIVNVGSIAGANGGGPGSGAYAAAKAYIHNLTRHMATDLAPRGIRVNAIAPGVIDTPFHAATPPERMEAMRKAVAMGRLGLAEDCAGPIVFLASEMSGYVTGQILHVNGGQYMP